MNRKLLRWLSVFLVLAVLLLATGCAGGETPSGSSDTSDGQSEAPSSGTESADEGSGEAIELTFITPTIYVQDGSDPGQIENFERSMAALESEFPNVTFVYEEYPHSTYEDKVKSLAAADNLPDIFILKSTMIQALVEAEQIMSFDEALDADPEWRDNFREGMFTEAIYQDQIWAIPEYTSMNGIIYYNKTLLGQLGFDAFPETMDELWTLIDAANAEGIIPFAAGASGGWEPFSLFQNALLYRYTGSQWFVDILNQEEGVSFLDQEFIDAAAEGQALAMGGAFNEDWYEIGDAEATALFTSGQAVMTLTGSWAIATINTSGMDVDTVGLAAMPKVEGYPNGDMTIHGSTGWMLFAGDGMEGEKLDAALCFIKNMSNAAYATTRLEAGSFPAMNPDDTLDESLVSPLAEQHDALVAECGQSLVIDCVMDPQVVEILYQDTPALYLGNITPEQFAQNVQNEYEALKAAE